MPPFGRLAGLVIAGKSEAALDGFCRDLARAAPRYEDVFVLGPAPAPIAMIRGQHRRRFLVKAPRNTNLQKLLSDWLSRVKIPSAVRLKVDIDPYSFFRAFCRNPPHRHYKLVLESTPQLARCEPIGDVDPEPSSG